MNNLLLTLILTASIASLIMFNTFMQIEYKQDKPPLAQPNIELLLKKQCNAMNDDWRCCSDKFTKLFKNDMGCK